MVSLCIIQLLPPGADVLRLCNHLGCLLQVRIRGISDGMLLVSVQIEPKHKLSHISTFLIDWVGTIIFYSSENDYPRFVSIQPFITPSLFSNKPEWVVDEK
jgi:hypothetical protein